MKAAIALLLFGALNCTVPREPYFNRKTNQWQCGDFSEELSEEERLWNEACEIVHKMRYWKKPFLYVSDQDQKLKILAAELEEIKRELPKGMNPERNCGK